MFAFLESHCATAATAATAAAAPQLKLCCSMVHRAGPSGASLKPSVVLSWPLTLNRYPTLVVVLPEEDLNADNTRYQEAISLLLRHRHPRRLRRSRLKGVGG